VSDFWFFLGLVAGINPVVSAHLVTLQKLRARLELHSAKKFEAL